MATPRILTGAMALIARFRRDEGGNLSTIFAFSLLPILAAVGCATDYSLATRMKAKMQSAADAAAVASVSANSLGYNAAITMTSNGSVAAGVSDANNIFTGNLSNITGYNNLSESSTVVKTGSTLTSQIQFSALVPTVFMNVLGWSALTINGSSSASSSLPLYLDFYLMLDVSGSMGLPSTNGEETRLAAINPDNYVNYPTGCTLACHFTPANSCGNSTQQYPTNNMCLGYLISRTSQSGYQQLLQNNNNKLPAYRVANLPSSLYAYNSSYPNDPALTAVSNCATDGTDACIQLRADAVGYAVNQLFVTANATQKFQGQFRIGLYPFIEYLYSYFPLTSSINGSASSAGTINYAAANLASLLDTNANASLGSGGTHFENALPSMNSLITSVGDGSASNSTLPYVFLVTDGAEDPQTKVINGGSWAGSNHATTLNPTTLCTPLKNRGITVSVLYIPYQPIQNPNSSFAGNEDGYANANIPNIPPSLTACASPGFFYTANTPADITAALNQMFNHALVEAHITN